MLEIQSLFLILTRMFTKPYLNEILRFLKMQFMHVLISYREHEIKNAIKSFFFHYFSFFFIIQDKSQFFQNLLYYLLFYKIVLSKFFEK